MNIAEKLLEPTVFFNLYTKVSKDAKIRNRYNQVSHLTQDTNGESQVTIEFRLRKFLVQERFKVSKGAKIRNRYDQEPHLTQDTNGKVTNSQLDATNESQEVSHFPACNHKAENKQTHTKA